jgi:hypothetical protein
VTFRELGAAGSEASLPRATFPELIRRAVVAAGALRSGPGDLAWVREVLTPSEHDLWSRQSPFDQDHVLQVARRVERRLAATHHANDSRWIGAALMHDVGKAQAGLTSLERAFATLVGRTVRLETARRWAAGRGLRARIGAYLTHGEIGARMIRAAGGRHEIAAWAEVHQSPQGAVRLGIPQDVVDALLESDVA